MNLNRNRNSERNNKRSEQEPGRNLSNRNIEQNEIQFYIPQRAQIRNKGYLDREKRENNTRLLSININGMRIKDKVKIQQMIDFSIQYKVNIIMITETNSK